MTDYKMTNCLHSINNNEITVHLDYCNHHTLKKIFISNRTGEVLALNAVSDFEIQVEAGCRTEIISAANCLKNDDAFQIINENNTIRTRYFCGLAMVDITYSLFDHLLYKNIQIKMNTDAKIKQIFSEKSKTRIPLSRGGEGQPVFLGNMMFAGIEFPAANNQIDQDTIALKQSPFIEMKAGEIFNCYPVVFGLNNCGTLEKSFPEYIRKITKIRKEPLKIYCDWGLHDELSDEKNLDFSMADGAFRKMNEIKRDGFEFQYYLMDAFWYENGLPYTQFKKEGFPEGIEPLLRKMDRESVKFGLWFDVNFNNVQLKVSDSYLLRTCDNPNQLCLSQPEVSEMLENGLMKQLDESSMKMIKFDFANFDCARTDHPNHSAVYTESKEPAISAFINIIKKIRTKNPDIKILGYNGFTTSLEWIGSVYTRPVGFAVSPWWCLYMDYIYCGDPRPSDIAADSLEKSIHYYTDAMVYQFSQALFPNEFIDDHGTMVASTGTMYGLERKGMYDGLILNVVRGTNKIQFYGDIHQLGIKDIPYLKWCESVLNNIYIKKMKTSFIAGDPLKGEVYGYSNSDGKSGYITMINPGEITRKIRVSLKEWENNGKVRIHKIYDNESVLDEEEMVIEDSIFICQMPHCVTTYQWESAEDLRSDDYYLTVKPCEEISMAVPADVSVVTLYFKDPADVKKPLRLADAVPEGFEYEFKNCSVVSGTYEKIWSGISWKRFKLHGARPDAEVLFKMSAGENPVELKVEFSFAESSREGESL